MRTVATGFFLGYLTVALLAAPTILCALHVTSSYGDGVVVVLDRGGVLAPLRNGIAQFEKARNRLINSLEGYIASKLEPRLPAVQ